MPTRHLGVLAVFIVLWSSGPPQAQTPDRNPLGQIKNLKCTFSTAAAGSWKTGEPKAEVKTEAVTLEISSIDSQEGSAQVTGSPPSNVTALLTASALHFLERTTAGNVIVITVFSGPGPTGKLRAVRSQHDYLQMKIPGFVAEPTVTQHYGECEVVGQ